MKFSKVVERLTTVSSKILSLAFQPPPGCTYGEMLEDENKKRVRKGKQPLSYDQGLRILRQYHVPVFKSKKDKEFERHQQEAIKAILF